MSPRIFQITGIGMKRTNFYFWTPTRVFLLENLLHPREASRVKCRRKPVRSVQIRRAFWGFLLRRKKAWALHHSTLLIQGVDGPFLHKKVHLRASNRKAPHFWGAKQRTYRSDRQIHKNGFSGSRSWRGNTMLCMKFTHQQGWIIAIGSTGSTGSLEHNTGSNKKVAGVFSIHRMIRV